MSDLVQQASEYVFELFKNELPKKFTYHDFEHTSFVASNTKEIADHYEISGESLENLMLAAWFHDIGYIKSYDKHEKYSVELASGFLKDRGLDEERITEIARLINATQKGSNPKDMFEELIKDADLMNIGKKRFFKAGKALRSEWEMVCDAVFTDEVWENEQYEFLVNTDFRTEYALTKYGPQRKKNIVKQRKLMANEQPVIQKAAKPGRGVETMYRSAYRNHINLSSIADNKANMMISINTIIMSLIIAVIGSVFTFTGSELIKHLRFTIPIGILLICCLVSAIFAILSARPKVTNRPLDMEAVKNRKTSLLFFGNFVNLSLPDFINGMRDLKEDNELLYDNMSVDIYYLGKVLTRKYGLLRSSYDIFMVGLTLSVVVFMIMFVFSYEKM